jgi:hypothetical protein
MNKNLKNKIIIGCIAGCLGSSLFATTGDVSVSHELNALPADIAANQVIEIVIKKTGIDPDFLPQLQVLLGDFANDIPPEQWAAFLNSCMGSCPPSVDVIFSAIMEAIKKGDIVQLEAIFDRNIAQPRRDAHQTENTEKINQTQETYNLYNFERAYRTLHAPRNDLTALERAVRLGNIEIVALLLFHNILPYDDNFENIMQDLINLASQNEYESMVRFLERYLSLSGEEDAEILAAINRGPAWLDKDAHGNPLDPQKKNIVFARRIAQELSSDPSARMFT